ncbi:MAG TPA: VIT1/CCC1 transporter family protein [Anaerolineales bacterium]|nr:VIT1/CCC1 transporter family protein [Anaerolineales bacterium]
MPSKESLDHILETFQRIEITEHQIYSRLAKRVKEPENREILERIAEDELRHSQDLRKYTQREIKPNRWHIFKYTLISRIFGFTFGIKLMERGEEAAQANYAQLRGKIPEIDRWIHEEEIHEQNLLAMLDEERLRYAGSVVLGLNDALVELTGALAGLTLALRDVKLIALSGLITGIAASLSMAASEYLSTRSEETQKRPVQAAVYTGIAYVITVALLVLPYLVIPNYFIDLAIALVVAVLIIAIFNYYISVAKNEPFRPRFLEMAGLSLGVAAFSFIIGFFIRQWLGVEV